MNFNVQSNFDFEKARVLRHMYIKKKESTKAQLIEDIVAACRLTPNFCIILNHTYETQIISEVLDELGYQLLHEKDLILGNKTLKRITFEVATD